MLSLKVCETNVDGFCLSLSQCRFWGSNSLLAFYQFQSPNMLILRFPVTGVELLMMYVSYPGAIP